MKIMADGSVIMMPDILGIYAFIKPTHTLEPAGDSIYGYEIKECEQS